MAAKEEAQAPQTAERSSFSLVREGKTRQTHSRNKIQHSRKTGEKIPCHNHPRGGRSGPRHNAKGWSRNMQRRSTGWIGALTGISLAMLAVAQPGAAAAVTRSEYCSRLGLQLDGAIQTKADPGANAREIAEATALQDKANRFCAERKQAQGIRTFANALKLLGVTPVDLNQ
jgi:hypothetical protein